MPINMWNDPDVILERAEEEISDLHEKNNELQHELATRDDHIQELSAQLDEARRDSNFWMDICGAETIPIEEPEMKLSYGQIRNV